MRNKYPILGFAPGSYMGTCVNCKKTFMGDKRAIHCEPCAIILSNEHISKNRYIKINKIING